MENLNNALRDAALLLKSATKGGESEVNGIDSNLETLRKILDDQGLTTQGESENTLKTERKPSAGIILDDFVDGIEALLLNYGEKLNESNIDPSAIDAEETENISCLVQFIVKFGVIPYLDKGVGNDNTTASLACFKRFTPRDKCNILFRHACCVYEMCMQSQVIRSIAINTTLTSIISSFLQMCFSPMSARILEKPKRQKCMNFLNNVICNWISKERLIEEILVLQGTTAGPTSPKWLQDKCGVMLSRILMEQNGMKAIIMTMLKNLDLDQPGEAKSWEEIVVLSSILSTLPSCNVTPKMYCEAACPQLLELLAQSRQKRSNISDEITRVCVTTIHALHEKYPNESSVFQDIICKPLSRLCQNEDDVQSKIDDVDLTGCIENLHQICVSVGVPPDSLISLLISPYFKVLFTLVFLTQDSLHGLTSMSLDIIKSLLKSMSCPDAANLLLSVFKKSYGNEASSVCVKMPLENLTFSVNEDGEVIPQIIPFFDPAEILHKQDIMVQVLIDIITKSGVDGLAGEVFLLLLKNLCDDSKNLPYQVNDMSVLLSDEDKAAAALEKNQERFITFGLISAMCELINPTSLLSDVTQMLTFTEAMLKNLSKNLEEDCDSSEIEFLKMCVSVLGICLMSDMNSAQKGKVDEILPVLQEISSKSILNDGTKDLILDLIIAIRTFGAASATPVEDFSKAMRDELLRFEKMNVKDDRMQQNEEENNTKPESNPVDAEQNHHTINKGSDMLTENLATSFQEAMDDVFDSSPALKGGSIRYLTKCIEGDLPDAIQSITKLSEIFMENLDHQDSFVYLSAIQGLAVISNHSSGGETSGRLLEQIVEKFLAENLASESADFRIEFRVKLGEVITRIIKTMGDMGPHHASVLLPEFLKSLKHGNSVYRASCLSNFSELAPLAPYYLSQIQYEIKDCLCGIAESDTDILVRRSAVFAIYQLVINLGTKVVEIFSGTIRDFYKLLKRLYGHDNDNTVQLHSQLALEELDKIMRESIFKPQSLTKKITVLP